MDSACALLLAFSWLAILVITLTERSDRRARRLASQASAEDQTTDVMACDQKHGTDQHTHSASCQTGNGPANNRAS